MSGSSPFSETSTLLRAVVAGDRGALNALLVKYQDRIHKIARFKLGAKLRRKMDSMDIVQDAMLKALESAAADNGKVSVGDFPDEPSFVAWLYKLVERLIIDVDRHYNAGKRDMSSERSMDRTAGDRAVQQVIAARGNPADDWDDLILLESLLDRLDEDEKEIIIEIDIYGFTFKQLADRLALTYDACRMRYNRAKFKLTKMVKDD